MNPPGQPHLPRALGLRTGTPSSAGPAVAGPDVCGVLGLLPNPSQHSGSEIRRVFSCRPPVECSTRSLINWRWFLSRVADRWVCDKWPGRWQGCLGGLGVPERVGSRIRSGRTSSLARSSHGRCSGRVRKCGGFWWRLLLETHTSLKKHPSAGQEYTVAVTSEYRCDDVCQPTQLLGVMSYFSSPSPQQVPCIWLCCSWLCPCVFSRNMNRMGRPTSVKTGEAGAG